MTDPGRPPAGEAGGPGPGEIRRVVGDFVATIHAAYAREAEQLPPAMQGRLPLVRAGHFTVAAVATGDLHLVATEERLPSPTPADASLSGTSGPLTWTVCFFDPLVLPGLAALASDGGAAGTRAGEAEDVRRLLGLRTHLYHLALRLPAGLRRHEGVHAGAGLAYSHAAEAREFDDIRAVAPGRESLVDEWEGAARAGLRTAQVLLARAIAPASAEVEALTADAVQVEPGVLRRAVLEALRGRGRAAGAD